MRGVAPARRWFLLLLLPAVALADERIGFREDGSSTTGRTIDPWPGLSGVAAVEHSGLEGLLSEEVTITPAEPARRYLEPEEGDLRPPARVAFEGGCSGDRYVRIWHEASHETAGQIALSLRLSRAAEYVVQARLRGHGSLTLRCADQQTAGRSSSDAWQWQPLGRLRLPAGEVSLQIESDSDGLAVDLLWLTTTAEPPPMVDDRPTAPAAVQGLRGEFREPNLLQLSWTASADPAVTRYDVHVGAAPRFTADNSSLLSSAAATTACDWGLAPGRVVYYQVRAVSSRGIAAAPAELRVVWPTWPTATVELAASAARLSGGLQPGVSRGVEHVWLPLPAAASGPRPRAEWEVVVPRAGRYYVWARYATYDARTVGLLWLTAPSEQRAMGVNWRLRLPGTLPRHLNGVEPGAEIWFSDKWLAGFWAGPTDYLDLSAGTQRVGVEFEPTQSPRGPRLATVWLSSDPSFRPPGYDPRIDFVK
ncbi:MAG: fibronectin type III domain-containing protein [Fimbriimonadaceae bacterium]|nr:fibronectin type III domain-containing protein [Fimbriimonadaceae bacterium]